MSDVTVNTRLMDFYASPTLANDGFIGLQIHREAPNGNSISSGVLNSKLYFNYQLGSREWEGLNEDFIVFKCTVTSAADPHQQHITDAFPASAIISHAVMMWNGEQVSMSNNWTQDSVFAKRIARGKEWLDSNYCLPNSTSYTDAIDNVDDATGVRIFTERLDAFSVNNDNNYIPPNTVVDMQFDIRTATIQNLIEGISDGTASDLTIAFNDVYLVRHVYQAIRPMSGEHFNRVVRVNSNIQTAEAVSFNHKFNVGPSCFLIGIAFLHNSPDTAVSTNTYYKIPQSRFLYSPTAATYVNPSHTSTTSYVVTARSPDTFSVTFGSHNVPAYRLDGTYGYGDGHQLFLNACKTFRSDAGNEKLADWLNAGPIWAFPVVKSSLDPSNTVNLQISFKTSAPQACNCYLFSLEEVLIKTTYDPQSGGRIGFDVLS